MKQSRSPEVALWFTSEQYREADLLTFELNRLGIAVFRHDFDYSELSFHAKEQELFNGTDRAKAIIVFYSKDFEKKVYYENERDSLIDFYKEHRNIEIILLRCDRASAPIKLSTVYDLSNQPDKRTGSAIRMMADEISARFIDSLEESLKIDKMINYQLTSLVGQAWWEKFDQKGQLTIGRNKLNFELHWGKFKKNQIYAENDTPSIDQIALARGFTSIKQIVNARNLDFKERLVSLKPNDIVVMRNIYGFYAAVQILCLVPINKEKPELGERLKIRYYINPEGSDDFSDRKMIHSVSIKGYRSCQDVQLNDLGSLVVFIGQNGSGKTNIFKLFNMMSSMLKDHRLAVHIAENGGADNHLYGGVKTTKKINIDLLLSLSNVDYYGYKCELKYTDHDKLVFTNEEIGVPRNDQNMIDWIKIENQDSLYETGLVGEAHRSRDKSIKSRTAENIENILGDIQVYHFNDTSRCSPFHTSCDFNDNIYLKSDGSNLAAVLLRLKNDDSDRYDNICYHIHQIIPSFDQFVFLKQKEYLLLEWKSANLDKSFGASSTSDGTLRTFALITLLNLPLNELPPILFIDEPELGFYYDGIDLIGSMITSLSVDKQIFLATQSPLLIDSFSIDDILLFSNKNNETRVKVLNSETYKEFLDDGELPSQLWMCNILDVIP